MNAIRRSSIIIGTLFIAATAFSILGHVSYGPILNNPDYIIYGPTSENQIVLGAIFGMLAAVSVAGTAIAFFPILRKRDEPIALVYIGGRLLEAFLIIIGLVSILTLLTLRQEFALGVVLDTSSLQTADHLLRSTHAWAFILGPNFILGISTLLYSSILYRSRLIPRGLATLGMVGAIFVIFAALLELFGVILQVSAWGSVLSLPVGVYEIALGVYLIVKGFKLSATDSESAKTEMKEQIVVAKNREESKYAKMEMKEQISAIKNVEESKSAKTEAKEQISAT